MRALVAGFGNSLFGDYAYGIEVARLLEAQEWPPQVTVANFGLRGSQIEHDMLAGYNLIIFIDAVWRGGPPGTLYTIEPEKFVNTILDAHAIELHSALAVYEAIASTLSADERPSMVIIGCEPESTDEGVGISAAVTNAIPATLPLVLRTLAQYGIGVGIYENRTLN